MKILALYEKKLNKKISENYLELDLTDLEAFGYHENKAFFDIPSKVIGGKNIMEWFALDNMSMWWFVAPVVAPKFIQATTFIDRLKSIILKHSPNKIVLCGEFDKVDLIKQICKLNKIDLKISIPNYFVFLLKKFFENLVKRYAYEKITKRKHRQRLQYYPNKQKLSSIAVGSTVITSHGLYRRETIDPASGKARKEEFFLQPIMDLLTKSKMPVICFDLDYTFRGETEALEERVRSEYHWIPVEVLIDGSKGDFTQKSILKLRRSVHELLKNDMTQLFNYEDVSTWEYLKPTFKEIFFEPYLPTYLHLIEKLEEFFSQKKPKAVIQVYETGPYAKAFEVVAKKLGIKTIGIEHGSMIRETNPDYMHKEIQNKTFPLGNPIPDITFVYGEFHKKILTEKGSYPNENIAVTGNLSFYNIERIKNTLNRNEILSRYQIPDKKVVLVPLSFRLFNPDKNNPDRILLDTIFNHLNDDDTVVLVRPHPQDIVGQSQFEQMFPKKNFKCSQGNIFEDLFVSDLVVVTYSSVGVEAALFEKPILLVNVVDEKGSSPFGDIQRFMIENELARQVHIGKLIQEINSIKKGELWKVEESTKRQEFLRYFFNYGVSVDLMKLIYGN